MQIPIVMYCEFMTEGNTQHLLGVEYATLEQRKIEQDEIHSVNKKLSITNKKQS